MPQINKTSRGGALLTALFIMTLVAIVATAMSTKVQLDIYRTQLIITHDRLYLASQAVTFWSMSELNNEKNQFTKTGSHGMVAQYPSQQNHIYNSVTLTGQLYDLQSRFNLNNLSNKKAIPGFVNLLGGTVQQLANTEKTNLALAINDWISPYDLARGKDKYLSYYMNQKPPYYPSHQLMVSNSELRLIKDVSAPIYLALEPYITTLPEPTPININTASKQVLMSLSNTIHEDQVKELIMARGENGFKNIQKANVLLKKLNILTDQITIESHYFLSVAHATSGDLELTIYTLFKRNRDKNKKLTVSILRESLNVF